MKGEKKKLWEMEGTKEKRKNEKRKRRYIRNEKENIRILQGSV
jgi:hypothetical protein